MDIVEQNWDKPWDWDVISRNPNITMEFIERNIDKISFYWLSQNLFTLQKKIDRIKKKSLWIVDFK